MIIDTAYMNERPAKWLYDQTGIPVVKLPATVDFQKGESLQQWYETVFELLLEPVK